MDKTILISIPVEDLQSLIIDCVTSCLKHNPQPESIEKNSLLTVKEAAKLLTLSVPTIYSLVSRSEIPVSKRGKRLYFSKQELIDWIKAGRKQTNAEFREEAHAQLISLNKKRS